MPDLSHLWQRFLQALAMLLGLAVGIAATVFGYSNTGTVTVGFSVWHLSGVPLWSVTLVPLGVLLVLGTLYHWWHGLHHFTEHMRHRRRVRDLEAEVASLKAHFDKVLEMPDHGATPKPAPAMIDDVEPAEAEPAEVEVAQSNGSNKKPEPAVVAANGEDSSAAESTEAANSKA